MFLGVTSKQPAANVLVHQLSGSATFRTYPHPDALAKEDSAIPSATVAPPSAIARRNSKGVPRLRPPDLFVGQLPKLLPTPYVAFTVHAALDAAGVTAVRVAFVQKHRSGTCADVWLIASSA